MMITEKLKTLSTGFEHVKSKGGFIKDGDWIESKDQDPNGEVRLIQLADIGDGDFLNKSSRYLTKEKATQLGCTFLKKGDVLVARMPDPIGRACIFPGDERECITAVDVMIIRTNENEVNNRWLRYKINSPEFRNRLNNHITGTTRQRISRSNFERIPLEIPDIFYQNKSADLLDRVTSLIHKRKETINLADEFLRSTFLEMFGDPIYNTKKWKTKILGLLGDGDNAIVDGPFGSQVNVKEDYVEDGDIPVVRTKNVSPLKFVPDDLKFMYRQKFESVSRSRVIPGDIILTKVGTIGNVCLFPETFKEGVLSTTGSCKITPDQSQISTRFLLYFLHNYRPKLLEIASQGVQAFLNMSHIKNIPVIIPPIELQNKFEIIVQKSEGLKNKLFISLTEIENQFNSIMQKAFKGEL